MANHILLSVLVFLSFVGGGHRNLTKFFLFWAIFSLPFEYDFSAYRIIGVENFQGWTDALTLRLSDVFVFLLMLTRRPGAAKSARNGMKLQFGYATALFVAACLISLPAALWRNYGIFELVMFCKMVFLYYVVFR